MIKNYCLIRLTFFTLFILQAPLIFSQTIGLYQFTGNNCSVPNYNVTNQPAGAIFSQISTNLTCQSGTNNYVSSNWNTDTTNTGIKYLQFSLQAGSTTNLIISQFKYSRKRSETGPQKVIVKYSTDGVNFQDYSTSLDSVKTFNIRKSITRQIISEKGAKITFRIYGWNAADASGILYIDEIEILGAVLTGPTTFYSQSSGSSTSKIWSTTPQGTKIPAIFNAENSLVVQATHNVKVASDFLAKNLTINSTGKLYAGSASEYTVTLYGNLISNGNFGNGSSASDKLSLVTKNISSISGNGILHTFSLRNENPLSFAMPLYIQGNLVANASINFNNNPVTFKSSEGQIISGKTPLSFKNLYTANTAGLTNNNQLTITGALNLTSGTFYTSDKVLLDLNSGYISRWGTGTLSGKIKVKKAVSGNEYGYHHLAIPLSDVTISELADNTPVEVKGYSWIYTYNEADKYPSADSGWVPVSGLSTILEPRKGYSFYFNKPTSLDFSGTYTNTSLSLKLAVTNTNSGDPASDGWNLIGNPFPAPIDWTLDSGWTKTNVNNAVYIWNPKTGKYQTYINGASINGGSPIISSLQSFYVKSATGAKPSLSVNKKAITAASNPSVVRTALSPSAGFKISVSNNSGSDETLIRLHSEADTSFNDELDAYKLFNGGNNPSIFTNLNGINYSVNSLPEELSSLEIPLVISPSTSGNYLISASDLSVLGDNYIVSLTDNLLNKKQNLNSTPNYSALINLNESKDRFTLTLENARTTVVTGLSNASTKNLNLYCFDKKLFINLSEKEASSITLNISDASGNLVINANEVKTNGDSVIYNVDSLKPGLYLVSVSDGEKLVTQKIVLY